MEYLSFILSFIFNQKLDQNWHTLAVGAYVLTPFKNNFKNVLIFDGIALRTFFWPRVMLILRFKQRNTFVVSLFTVLDLFRIFILYMSRLDVIDNFCQFVTNRAIKIHFFQTSFWKNICLVKIKVLTRIIKSGL